MAPGGTESELGFCAGVSSLITARRAPAAGVGTRASRGRPLAEPGSASVLDAGAASAAARATASAGDSRPICVVVRVGCSGAREALGREDVLRGRRECGRGAELGLGLTEIPPGVVSIFATASGAGALDGTELADTELAETELPLAVARLALEPPTDGAGGSDPERAPTA
jgi:hypothetical protein